MKKFYSVLLALCASLCFIFSACAPLGETTPTSSSAIYADDLNSLPEFSNSPYVIINNNQPYFTQSEITSSSYEYYSPLDGLGRCGVTHACIGTDIMPTEERGEIGMIKPSGWQTVKYDIVSGKYLYNRCHLIGFQLAGENANERNLITGTRYLNVEGMLPFENMVADYVKETENHVLYRVTPIFKNDELVARGVLMEALSVEDNGKAICFNVYCYNNQPGVVIDYKTGLSALSGEEIPSQSNSQSSGKSSAAENSSSAAASEISSVTDSETSVLVVTFVFNTSTKKFHLPECSSVKSMSEQNRQDFYGTRDEAIGKGYAPCGICKP
ncbi:MAG: DNA/RNA non-specific endonuclease [Christensenellaceae bacterium]